MRALLSIAALALMSLCATAARCGWAMDTTRFATPTPVAGNIPGLFKWANSVQSDSADIVILAPVHGQRFNAGDSIFVNVSVAGIAIGAQTQHADDCGLRTAMGGQHTHVLLNDDSLLTNYKSGVPFYVGIAHTGVHTVSAFACRSWHESIKSPGAFKSVTIFVDSGAGQFDSVSSPNLEVPIVILNQPIGEYEGTNALAILIDFVPPIATHGTGDFNLRLTVDGASTVLTEWVPYLITGLGPGEHRFRIEGIKTAGQPSKRAANPAERVITVK